MKDVTNLNRFLDAQNTPGYAGYNQAVEEIKRGKKLSHWIWYVFPQLKSLNQNSPDDKKYGIENLGEAKAYLNNPILRKRLDDICDILLEHEGKTASSIFGVSDSARVRSSMTLFYLASNNELYKKVLDKYYNGRPCQNTLYLLNMKMPEPHNITKENNESKKKDINDHKHSRETIKSKSHASISRQRILRKRKMKKTGILFGSFICIIALLGGMGYGAYMMFFCHEKEPIVAEVDNVDLNVNIVVQTSDQKVITIDDKDKYAMSLIASIGNTSIQQNPSTSKFNFSYNNENSSEEIKIDAKVETCKIGGQTYTLSYFETKEGIYDGTFILDVSSEELRIYEELAWYQSVNKKVSSKKYSKYVSFIKNVQNKDFAALLTKKLSSIGCETEVQDEPKKVEPKKETPISPKGVLPMDVRVRIRHAEMIPESLMRNVSSHERYLLMEYNRWLSRMFHRMRGSHRKEIVEKELQRCMTFKELERIIRIIED